MPLMESLSGVRGVYNIDLTDKVASNYAKAYYSYLSKKNVKIVIGTDTRSSNINLKKVIINTLNCHIIDLGTASTPMTELAVRHFQAQGGIIVTASHNPPEHNGFKFLSNTGSVLSESEMNKVIDNYRNNNFIDSTQEKVVENKDIKQIYYEFVKDIINQKFDNVKIVVDPNGGTAIHSIELLKNLGIEIIEINTELGTFKRTIEPNKESLSYLREIINENNADFAVGFDCDADRAEILLKDGTIVSGNELLALSCYYYLQTKENQLIVVNDATSYVVKEVVEKFNSKTIETGVGEANVVEEMYDNNSILGGEGSSSGVIIPPSRCRDGTLSLLTILSLMKKENKTIEELISLLPKYYTITKKLILKKPFQEIKNKILEHYKDIKSHSDSIKIKLSETSFIWLRQSKTEANLLRIIADSKDPEISKKLIEELNNILTLQ